MKRDVILYASAKSTVLFVNTYLFLLAMGVSLSVVTPICFAQPGVIRSFSPVDDAHSFLRTEARGREVLNFLHAGANYHGHGYLRKDDVADRNGTQVPGHFALVYRYRWENDGITDVAYLCDGNGYVYKVQVTYTNAVFSQPFLLVNATIKLLGNAWIESNKDNMSPLERKIVQKLVDEADAKGLLEWSLRFEQRLNR